MPRLTKRPKCLVRTYGRTIIVEKLFLKSAHVIQEEIKSSFYKQSSMTDNFIFLES